MSDLKINLPYVHADRDRHGNLRVYFRRALGCPKIRLRAAPGSPEFNLQYNAALAGTYDPKPAIHQNTYQWLCNQYFTSPKYAELDPRTQRTRRQILEHTFDEVIADGSCRFGQVELEYFTSKAVRDLRNRKQDKPEAANNRVKAIRQVFKWALDEEVGGVTANPAREVSYLKSKGKGFHSWTEDEVARFEARHPPGTKAYLALMLLSYTGVRRSDVVRLGPAMVKDGWLSFVPFKGRNKSAVPVEIPVVASLEKYLDMQLPAFLMTEQGRPFSAAGFGNWFRDRCNEAGLPECSAHGLRKAGAALAAENGATPHELMSIFGWLTLKEAERYTKAASRRRMSARAGQLLTRTSPPSAAGLPHSA